MADTAALKRGPLTVAIMMATVMQVPDTTIANVALPRRPLLLRTSMPS